MFTYEQIQSLNDLEFGVYNYVIQHIVEVRTMKIRELADNAHVSTTTVLNFCNKMGCKGYSEFKIKLQLMHEKEELAELTDDTVAMMDFFKKINTDDFKDQINHSAEIIANASSVFFYGIGSSGILGQYGARYLSNMGIYATHINDPFYPIPQEVKDNTILIVLSVSGETSMVLHRVSEYKQNNFKIISITNSDSSTLSKISDGAVGYYMPIEKKGPIHNITTQVPVIHIIETLARKAFEIKNQP
ncbi:MurR/RpiR family transcriptional regulator [Vagococcus sp. BWB3-3]|uniref:MurR/RpiR family transcriptional regulator n=1 Tax=Vagococcus allomyrinae TaxID=2794353 RepID=A0A940PB78_9ENTE|nr:MurR/RpiR family transcriptional regulator [Vagococcus allomyrinae]MBP1041769.1 MurR/RpiR family transcriptional regulator [Vagococcus allomyrinae]